MGRTKLIVSGQEVGEFLAFYFNDEGYYRYRDKASIPVFREDRCIDIHEFLETAARFDVTVEIGYDEFDAVPADR